MLTFAVAAVSRRPRATRGRHLRGSGAETALLSAALQEAVTKLKAQERATAARAEASERLSGEIIASLTAGLLVVGLHGEVRILNPAGRRMLDLADGRRRRSDYRDVLATPAAGRSVIDECLATARADRPPRRRPARSRGAARRISASPCRRSFDERRRCTARSACSPISPPSWSSRSSCG